MSCFAVKGETGLSGFVPETLLPTEYYIYIEQGPGSPVSKKKMALLQNLRVESTIEPTVLMF